MLRAVGGKRILRVPTQCFRREGGAQRRDALREEECPLEEKNKEQGLEVMKASAERSPQ